MIQYLQYTYTVLTAKSTLLQSSFHSLVKLLLKTELLPLSLQTILTILFSFFSRTILYFYFSPTTTAFQEFTGNSLGVLFF